MQIDPLFDQFALGADAIDLDGDRASLDLEQIQQFDFPCLEVLVCDDFRLGGVFVSFIEILRPLAEELFVAQCRFDFGESIKRRLAVLREG